jgi:hypothetical protein
MRHGVPGRCGVALQMHPDDRVPFRFAHIGERPVAQDAGIIDQNIEPPECVEGTVDECCGLRPVRHVVPVHHGLAACGRDLRRHLAGRGLVAAFALEVAAEVVHHQFRPVPGERQGM